MGAKSRCVRATHWFMHKQQNSSSCGWGGMRGRPPIRGEPSFSYTPTQHQTPTPQPRPQATTKGRTPISSVGVDGSRYVVVLGKRLKKNGKPEVCLTERLAFAIDYFNKGYQHGIIALHSLILLVTTQDFYCPCLRWQGTLSWWVDRWWKRGPTSQRPSVWSALLWRLGWVHHLSFLRRSLGTPSLTPSAPRSFSLDSYATVNYFHFSS